MIAKQLALASAALVAVVPALALAAPAALHYQLAPGDKLVYKLDYRSNSELNFGGLTKGQKGPTQGFGANADNESAPLKVRVSIKGNLVETVVAQDAGATTMAVTIEKPVVKFTTEGEGDDQQAAALAAGLGRTLFATVDAAGHVTALRFEDGTAPEVQLAARALIALVQFVLPEGDATPATWETKEQEPNGDYTARYTLGAKGKGGTTTVKKHKLAFVDDAPAEGPHEITVKKKVKAKGELTAQFDAAKGHLASLSGSELETVLINDRAVGKADAKLKLTLVSRAKAGAELAELTSRASSGTAVGLKSVEDKQATESAIEKNELKDQNADQLFAELAAVESGGGDEQPVYLKLKALFFVHPESAAKAGELLGKAKADGPTVRVLSGALGTVGNAECQAALAAAAKARPADDPALAAILPAMGELTKPLPISEDALRTLASTSSEGDGASTARLALGTMAATLAKSEPPRAEKIVADLSGLLDKSPSEEVSRQLLLALGNSSSPAALPELKKFAADKSSILREAAAKALGQSSSPDAAPLLQTLTADSDEHVKKAATDGLANRNK